MPDPTSPTARRTVRRASEIRRAVGDELRRLREDAGASLRAVSSASGVSVGHLWDIEAGKSDASTEALVAIGAALGADLSVRFYPGTGPRLRDRFQARMSEVLLRTAGPRWGRFLEVPVYRPARGVIDLVLIDEDERVVVGTELHSELRRLEQIVRWSNQKRDSLPSAELWRFVRDGATTSSALVVRNTRHNRETVAMLASTVGSAYPASTERAVDALLGDGPWPGAAMLWVDLSAQGDRLLPRPPRGVSVGRE
jgi:transcriptional regulator with XRE-family HTH domain